MTLTFSQVYRNSCKMHLPNPLPSRTAHRKPSAAESVVPDQKIHRVADSIEPSHLPVLAARQSCSPESKPEPVLDRNFEPEPAAESEVEVWLPVWGKAPPEDSYDPADNLADSGSERPAHSHMAEQDHRAVRHMDRGKIRYKAAGAAAGGGNSCAADQNGG